MRAQAQKTAKVESTESITITSLASDLRNHRSQNREDSKHRSKDEKPDSAGKCAEGFEVRNHGVILTWVKDAEDHHEDESGDQCSD